MACVTITSCFADKKELPFSNVVAVVKCVVSCVNVVQILDTITGPEL